MRTSHVLITIAAWLVGVAGGLWALIICLAAGMKGIPRLSESEAASALPLPLLAILTAVFMLRTAGAREHMRQYRWTLLPVLAISTLALAVVLLVWLTQPQ